MSTYRTEVEKDIMKKAEEIKEEALGDLSLPPKERAEALAKAIMAAKDRAEAALNNPIVRTEPKAKRYNVGKSEFFDAPLIALAEMAKVAAFGRAKYDKYNWKKGAPASQYHDCRVRHELKYWYGQDLDSDSKCYHLAHIAWNALAALEVMLAGTLDDDRYKGYSPEFVDTIEHIFLLNDDQKEAIQRELDKKNSKSE